jgi:hypothetical protein
MRRLILTAATILALSGALAACETATPYQPLTSSGTQAGGYSELKIEADRWRVSFQGNSLTSRQTVESYLLYRAAELTVAQGFDWFETADRHTDKHVESWVDPDPFLYGAGWHPYWRYYGGRRGWRGWDPYLGDPFFDVHTVEQYQASSEIVMGHGPKPAGDKRALDAHEVLANLHDHIVRPTSK